MEFAIPYGAGTMPLHIEKEQVKAVLVPPEKDKVTLPEAEIVEKALQTPIGSKRLSELAAGKKNICIITSDHTRPMPSKITLPLLLAEIRKGSPEADITVLIATGMHRSPTAEEMRERFGEELLKKEHFVIHDSRRDEDMRYLGKLPSGGDLLINKLAAECDLLVAEGFIEPHFFAGFSGGRKSVLPGVASYKTVMYNHNAAFIAGEKASHGILEGNPIHKDMFFAAEQAHLAFILNVLLDEKKKIQYAFSGAAGDAHREGCRVCEELCCIQPVTADIAVTSNGGLPLDQNIYQSVKGMSTAESCVRPGGVIIMCAECRDGHGGEAFVNWFRQRENADAVMRDILKVPAAETTPDQWQSQILARIMQKATCIFVSDGKNKKLIEDMGMLYAENADTALMMARKLVGADASVTVIPSGIDLYFKK